MSLTGIQIIKNGVKFDYPFVQSFLSIIPICDEFIFVEGFSEDGTYDILLNLQEEFKNIKIIRVEWRKSLLGKTLSEITNIGIENCKTDYYFNIQADEVVHEKDLKEIKNLCNQDFTSISFKLLHFWSSFNKVLKKGIFLDKVYKLGNRNHYPFIKSYDDAFSLSADYGSKDSDIFVYHYGFVRSPIGLINKHKFMVKEYYGFPEDERLVGDMDKNKIDWSKTHDDTHLEPFNGTHPKIMEYWIKEREPFILEGRIT